MATLPPAFTTRSQVAKPRPDAPPDTMAWSFSNRMGTAPGGSEGTAILPGNDGSWPAQVAARSRVPKCLSSSALSLETVQKL